MAIRWAKLPHLGKVTPYDGTPIAGSLGRVGRRKPLSEFQDRLLQMAEGEHSVRMEILDLKLSFRF